MTLRFTFPPSGIALPDLPPAPSDQPSVVAMSLPKAGSSLLFALLQGLAPAAGLAYISLEDHFFVAGVMQKDQPHEAASLFRPTGYCYGGFRGAPPFSIPILGTTRAVVLVRDPRDMAVSNWYSVTRSHVIPGGADGEHFMARHRRAVEQRGKAQHVQTVARGLDSQFERMLACGILRRPDTAVFRYEDVIFRKRDWVDEICAWLGWEIPMAIRHEVADSHDIVPERPDPDAHIRQVHPGNHRQELDEAAIAQMDRILRRWLAMFRYA